MLNEAQNNSNFESMATMALAITCECHVFNIFNDEVGGG